MHGERVPRLAVLSSLPPDIDAQVAAALREDVAGGDVTAALVPAQQRVVAEVIAREAAVLCGAPWFDRVFRSLDPSIRIEWSAADGERIAADSRVCRLSGRARPILTGERTALNFLQTLSGTATAARHYVDAVAGTGCTILDTRKTVPGLRLAQKYAVRCGGAQNHRLGLHDRVLIKENHIAAAGSIAAAVAAARRLSPGIPVEVEVESLAEFEEALAAAPEVIMLDEFSLADMRTAVARNRALGRHAKLEASGSVTLGTIRTVADTGVDFISVGAITKHVRALDLSLRITEAS
ncbi:MAG: Nicotinate-nucleotide pyrophosphorylase [carboxylating] [Steroidobacteraceae bacterium]|nr:Nicotinate-nucleotide pyrophosphorylase [carboxylating] [Steroidobacteraceae bacterium]